MKDLPDGVYPAEASPPKVRKYLKVSDIKPRPKSAMDYRQLGTSMKSNQMDKKNLDDLLTPRSASTHGDVFHHTSSRDQDLAYFPRRSMNNNNNSREGSLVIIPTTSYRFSNGGYDSKMSRDIYNHTLNQTSVDSNLILFSPQRATNANDRTTIWD